MKRALLAVLLTLGLVGCTVEPKIKYEFTGSGYVRSIDWYQRTFVFESDDGQLKTFNPCQAKQNMPVWEGMRAHIKFHWDSDPFRQCYWMDEVRHLKSNEYVYVHTFSSGDIN
jgi:hypothetical protein